MSRRTRGPGIILAGPENLRAHYRVRLSPGRRVVELDGDGCAPKDAVVDVAAAVVCLDAESGARTLDALETASQIPALSAMLLVADAPNEADLARALGRWSPTQVLAHPVPDVLLRFVLERLAPDGEASSARQQHRPAVTLLGVSVAIRKVLDEVAQVAPTRVSVLILGETGTGKELVARAIHAQSPRTARPFVAVNCSAFPEALLDAELFGFRRGAFTGADRDHRGLFQQADGGTIFLDELGDMPLSLQAKLLRTLESGEVRAVGDTGASQVDVRIISATNRDLERAIEEGRFRSDLYYRINTVTISLPPLRRRRVDIPFLAQHFAEQFGREHARQITLGEDFVEALAQRDFPGNVRELRNAVERAITLATSDEPLSIDAITTTGGAPPPLFAMGTLRDRVAELELQAIRSELERHGGNRSRVAQALGLSRFGLRKKMQRFGLE